MHHNLEHSILTTLITNMTFSALSEGHSCNCHSKAVENNTDTFARKVCDSKELKNRDFKTHYERGVSLGGDSCTDICGHRGVSIFIWNDQSSTYLLNKFSLTYNISPQLKRPKYQLSLFKIPASLGKVKHTPEQQHGVEPFHYDLYKSDTFSVDNLELIKLLPIRI